MIIREIKDNPDEELKNFDYFNDYSDTRNWLLSQGLESLIKRLDKGYQSWLQKRNK